MYNILSLLVCLNCGMEISQFDPSFGPILSVTHSILYMKPKYGILLNKGWDQIPSGILNFEHSAMVSRADLT